MKRRATENRDGNPIYLDYNATTPHDPEVIVAMRPYLEKHFGNPSSSHAYGRRARDAVDKARGQVASLLGCHPEQIVFTSGGTESNNQAIRGIAAVAREKGNHIITSRVEHPAVIEVCRDLEREGFEVSYLPVDEFGLVSVSELEEAITERTVLITIMHANNEVGTVQPIEEISRLARARGIVMHTDAAQSAGKIPTEVRKLGVQLLSLAGHKLYAPKGIGALYVQQDVQLKKFMLGAGQEGNRRAGTENVLEIVGLGEACEIAKRDLQKNSRQMRAARDRLHEGLISRAENLKLNGHPELRLPNTLNVSFRGAAANELLAAVQDRVAASAGSACHAGSVEISPVLKAMHVPEQWAGGAIRFSTGRMTTESEIEEAVRAVGDAVKNSAIKPS